MQRFSQSCEDFWSGWLLIVSSREGSDIGKSMLEGAICVEGDQCCVDWDPEVVGWHFE